MSSHDYMMQVEEIQKLEKEVLEVYNWLQIAHEERDKLKAELSQQRFNNKHNLSIDQKVTDEMERLRAENKKLEKQAEQWYDEYEKQLERSLELIKKYEPETLDY